MLNAKMDEKKELIKQLPRELRRRRISKIIVVSLVLLLLGVEGFAAPSYSNVGQNVTYVGMNEKIELRAKWTPGADWYDVSEGVYNDYLDVSSQDSDPTGLTFNNDGSKLYVVGFGNSRVYEYNLSTPYDISTGVYNDYLDVSTQDAYPAGLTFNDDGTKLYVVGNTNDRVYEYNLSTPYDISTGVYNDYLDVSSQESTPTGLTFNNDGSKLYVVGFGNDRVYEYNLSTPYDISTGVYNDCLDVSGQDTYPTGIAFNNDGSKLYVIGRGNDRVYEYSSAYKLDVAILYINLTGSYQAVDTIDLNDSITATWSNFSYTPTTCNKVVGWKITANDSSGTSNVTTVGTFYTMPYLVVGSGTLTCTNKHNATLTQTGSQGVSLYMPFFQRNATFKECSYTCNNCDTLNITNATEYCIVNATTKSVTSVRFDEGVFIKAFPPSSLPAALAGSLAVIVIVIYTYTTRKKITGW